MKKSQLLGVVCAALFTVTLSGTASAVSLGQVDDFQDTTKQNWTMGQDINSSNISTGGPAGAGDMYLESVGDNAGPGSKITIFNITQWTGNYTSVGVTTITMDLNNFSSNTPLTIRLGLSGNGGLFSTNSEITLGANSGWATAVFSVAAGDLTAVSGNSGDTGFDAALTLESVLELRIINSEDPSWS